MFLRTGYPRGQLCALFIHLLSLSPLYSPVLEPHLNLMFCKSKTQRQVISFAFVQVVLKLKAVFQSLALVVREHRTGPGSGESFPCCTAGSGVGNIKTLTKQAWKTNNIRSRYDHCGHSLRWNEKWKVLTWYDVASGLQSLHCAIRLKCCVK